MRRVTNSHRRRPSDVASDLIRTLFGRLTKKQTPNGFRSLSTGDLADSTVVPVGSEHSDYMEMQFNPTPTTSKLDPNFDDADRVPMRFSKDAPPKLLNQARASSRKLMCSGSDEDLRQYHVSDLHDSQKWFYRNVDSRKAERLLMDAGFQEGSFLIYCVGELYQICVLHNGKFVHLRILYRIKNGIPRWNLEINQSFKNLLEMVNYYRSHKGFVLPTMLKHGVARPVKIPTSSHRTRA
ncbi:unnamed protein product [Auanema sp. JU1783]|nr:unnamed protein product [Auanema sp. JU1783]